jgi:hypothetical protein
VQQTVDYYLEEDRGKGYEVRALYLTYFCELVICVFRVSFTCLCVGLIISITIIV